MPIINVIERSFEQGSRRWEEARRGIPTVSQLGNVVTATTCKKSASWKTYLCKLVASALGDDGESYTNKAMQTGLALEGNARAAYEWDFDTEVEQVGVVYANESRTLAASPDGLCGDDGGLEIKVPHLSTHLSYLLDDVLPSTYRAQVYGSLYVTGRDWWSFFSYSRFESVPHFHIRVASDDKSYIKWREAIDEHLPQFIEQLSALRDRVGLPPLGSDKTPALLERFAPQSPQYTSETIAIAEGMEVTYF